MRWIMASTMTAQIALLALALCLGSLACSADLAFTPNSLVLLGRAPCVSQLKDYDTISFGHSTVLNAFQLSKNPIIRGWPFPLGAYGKEPRGIPIALRAKIKGASDTPSETPVIDSMVLLKGAPVIVQTINPDDPEKVEVMQLNSKTKKARARDLRLLFAGPVRSWELQELKEELPSATVPLPEARAELEAVGGAPLSELAQILYGEATHLTTWAAWKTVEDGLYFHGEPGEVLAHTQEKVEAQLAAEAAAAAERADFDALVERVQARKLKKGDVPRLQSVEDVALMAANASAVMKGAGLAATPEQAQQLLLDLGIWADDFNPWPQRFRVAMDPPEGKVPKPDANVPVERTDLTHLEAWAIDQEGTEDPDDAISIEEGGKRVWVHVADVAAIVSAGSPLEEEARRRAATLYAPTGTVPMLPKAAASSLGLGLAKGAQPALSFGFTVDDDGYIEDVEVVRSTVKVKMMSYEEATSLIDAGKEPFASMDAIAQRFKDRRDANGAVGFQFPEAEVSVSASGEILVEELPQWESKDTVMEFMLMAGEACSQFAVDNEIPLLYSSQDAPSDPNTGKPLPIKRPRTLSQMFDLMKRMQKSTSATTPDFHFGLGMGMYSQVTSPLRRYGDLLNHLQIAAFLAGREVRSGDELLELMGEIGAKTAAVKKCERFSRQWYALRFLQGHADWEGEGVVLNTWQPKPLAPRVATVLIVELGLFASVKLRKETRPDEYIPVKLKEVKLVGMRAHFIHNIEPGQVYGTPESEKYSATKRLRKSVGTRLSSSLKRSG